MPDSTRLIIAANFTTEPVQHALSFWLARLQIKATIELAPYDQLFQQLLSSESALLSNRQGVNILLVRTQDWLTEQTAEDLESRIGDFNHIVRDFVGAVAAAQEYASSQLLVFCLPITGIAPHSPEFKALTQAEDEILRDLMHSPGVDCVNSECFAELYTLADQGFEQGRRIANIPYTARFYNILGTVLARRVYSILVPAHKVLVLDCDDTLWGGLCGEEGALGVEISQRHLALQNFAVEQQLAGKLICLASRNNEADVMDVFDKNPAMVLKREHLTAWSIHWGLKSDSMAELSQRLDLDPGSFVFIDDDAVQCAEVAHRFPEIISLTLPKFGVEKFCQHIWPLDNYRCTEEGGRRTDAYRDHIARENVRAESLSFGVFLERLNLDVSIAPLTPEELLRASELTQRTNQFNLSAVKMSEAEISNWVLDGSKTSLGVRVRDRFGDYGLVGLMFCEVHENDLVVPVYLLSCRALGRGVEHKMLARLGRLAEQNELSRLVLRCQPTLKNKPALEFLQQMTGAEAEISVISDVVLAVDAASGACIDVTVPPEKHASADDRLLTADPEDVAERSRFLASIPTEFVEVEAIQRAIEQERVSDKGERRVAVEDPVEAALLKSFLAHLGVDSVDVNEGFFELGGHSLQAVQILAEASNEFGVELDATLLFTTNFTVAELSQEIGFLASADRQDMAGVLNQLSAITDS